jgi:hypothetical protein
LRASNSIPVSDAGWQNRNYADAILKKSIF